LLFIPPITAPVILACLEKLGRVYVLSEKGKRVRRVIKK